MVLNYYILYSKYYIYIQRLYDNYYLDLYTCLTQLNHVFGTEYKICKTENELYMFNKFLFI